MGWNATDIDRSDNVSAIEGDAEDRDENAVIDDSASVPASYRFNKQKSTVS